MTNEQIKSLFGDNEEAYKDFQKKFNTSPDVKNMRVKIQNLQKVVQIRSSNAAAKEVERYRIQGSKRTY